MFYGEIKISNLEEFLLVFLDYPLLYKYQDIEVYSKNINCVINISSHGTLWIISSDMGLLIKLEKILLSNNFITLLSHNI